MWIHRCVEFHDLRGRWPARLRARTVLRRSGLRNQQQRSEQGGDLQHSRSCCFSPSPTVQSSLAINPSQTTERSSLDFIRIAGFSVRPINIAALTSLTPSLAQSRHLADGIHLPQMKYCLVSSRRLTSLLFAAPFVVPCRFVGVRLFCEEWGDGFNNLFTQYSLP